MNNRLHSALNRFGLTIYESKVYTALASQGISTAKDISNICGIPYGKIYEVITSLSKKGFIETLPTKPMKYRAVDPEEVTKTVKQKTIAKMEEASKTVLSELKHLFGKTKELSDSKSNFWVINGRNAVTKKMEEMLKRAKSNLYVHTTENGLLRLESYKEVLSSLSKKGVDIKISAKLSPQNKKTSKCLGFCEIIDSKNMHPNTLVSVDNEESFIFEAIPDDSSLNYGRDQGLWVSNPSFTEFMNTLFMSNYETMKKS